MLPVTFSKSQFFCTTKPYRSEKIKTKTKNNCIRLQLVSVEFGEITEIALTWWNFWRLILDARLGDISSSCDRW